MATSIGELISYYREMRKMTQNELAGTYCTRKTIFNIEKGINQPSLELIDYLSERLGVNLVSVYSNVYKHHDLDTHLKYMEINDAIARGDFTVMKELVEEYQNEEGFLEGEPRQLILYVKSILAGVDRDYDKAYKYAAEGMRISYPEYPEWSTIPNSLSNVESAVVLSNAVNLCRMGKKDEGLNELSQMEFRLKKLLSDNVYVGGDRKSVILSQWCSCVYNQYAFADVLTRDLLNKIDDIFEYQKASGRSHMLVELLLCEATIYMKMNNTKKAKETYESAKALGEIFYTPSVFNQKARRTIGAHSDIKLFDKKAGD